VVWASHRVVLLTLHNKLLVENRPEIPESQSCSEPHSYTRPSGPSLRMAGTNNLKALTAISAAQGVHGGHETQARFDALLASYAADTKSRKGARAHLHNCACRPASARLDTLPLSGALTLKSGEVQAVLRYRHRLGPCMLPLNAPTVQCPCREALTLTTRCDARPSLHRPRYAIISSRGFCTVSCTGRASRQLLNPPSAASPSLADGALASTAPQSASKPVVTSSWHSPVASPSRTSPPSTPSPPPPSPVRRPPPALTLLSATSRSRPPMSEFGRVEPNGYGFASFSVETYRRLGQPAMKLLHHLGDEAAGSGGVMWATLVSGALHELSVGLVRGTFWLYCASAGMLARASGSSFRPGRIQPTDDCVVE
jgi:hypothetical protein